MKKQNHKHHQLLKQVEEIEFSRRSLLRSGVSLTAYGSLGSILGGAFAAAQTSYPPKRKLVWINLSGGWDVLEATDPKPASTSGIDMVYSWGQAHELSGSSDGTKIGRWLPKIAALGSDVLVVRGLAMGTTSHMAGNVYMDTGILSNGGSVNAASIPAIVASESTATIPIIQLNGGSAPQIDRGLLNPVSVVRASNLDLYRSMYPDEEDLERKTAVLDYLKNSITSLESSVGGSDRLASLKAAEDKVRSQFSGNVGAKLSLSTEESTAFFEGAPENLIGGDAFALALKLINNDIVTAVNLGLGGFDTHQNQTTRLQPLMGSVDFLVAQLVAGLKKSDQLDKTLIVLYSDFGRTPKVNRSNGRDHWPTGGAILIGGGIDGGRSVGATDSNLQAAELIDPSTGLQTSDTATGVQLNPTHVGGAVVELCLGSGYSQYRPYLPALACMTRVRS